MNVTGTRPRIAVAVTLGGVFVAAGMVVAQLATDSPTSLESGGWTTNAAARTFVSVGGAQGGDPGASDLHAHISPLHGAAPLHPGQDSDADGSPDEWDPDNDNDGLSDWDEVSGHAFGGYARTDPNRADSDRDGMSDDLEAAAMFDPTDPGHALRIVAIERAERGVRVRWIGRGGGRTNTLYDLTALTDGPSTNVIDVRPYAGGTHPWFKATNTYVDTDPGHATRLYRVGTE